MDGANGMRRESVMGVETLVDVFKWVRSKTTMGVGGVVSALWVGGKPVVGVEAWMDSGDGVGGKTMVGVKQLGGGLR